MKYNKSLVYNDILYYRRVFLHRQDWIVEASREGLQMRCLPINLKRCLRNDWKSKFWDNAYSWNGVADEV